MEKTPYERVLLARDKKRPTITDYIEHLVTDFVEQKGDRLYGEDPSILGGVAFLGNQPVTILGHRKGRTTEENIRYHFGMTSPQGYRKAVRLMKQAERFQRPVICIVDTPGAYPGLEAESMGQSNAIAESIATMLNLKVPVLTIITGEGSSGGALALAAADRVYLLENAVYSILSPEGFASILWKDGSRVKEACERMKLTAKELSEYGLIDGILSEEGEMYGEIRSILLQEIKNLKKMSISVLLAKRYQKYRNIEGGYQPRPGR